MATARGELYVTGLRLRTVDAGPWINATKLVAHAGVYPPERITLG